MTLGMTHSKRRFRPPAEMPWSIRRIHVPVNIELFSPPILNRWRSPGDSLRRGSQKQISTNSAPFRTMLCSAVFLTRNHAQPLISIRLFSGPSVPSAGHIIRLCVSGFPLS